jgi:HPt (histidine-containing phosphotransfer) domain-containing protein
VERLRNILAKFGLEKPDAPAADAAAAAEPNQSTQPPDSAAPVDLRAFQMLTDGDQAFAQELVAAFILSGEQQLAEIAAALAQSHRAAVAKAAHKIKGASANIHAHALKSLADRMEIDCAAADAHALNQTNTLLRREFERVKAFLTDPAVIPRPTKAAS